MAPTIIGIRHPPPIPEQRARQLFRAVFCLTDTPWGDRVSEYWPLHPDESRGALDDLDWLIRHTGRAEWLDPEGVLSIGRASNRLSDAARDLMEARLEANRRVLARAGGRISRIRWKDPRLQRAMDLVHRHKTAASLIDTHLHYCFFGHAGIVRVGIPKTGTDGFVDIPIAALADIEHALEGIEKERGKNMAVYRPEGITAAIRQALRV